jgi:RNA polymerase sigma factor (sigma-70 family)
MPPANPRDPDDGSVVRRDERIPRRLAAGDEEAVTVVNERIGRILSFRGFGIPREDRRDIQQDVLAQVWQAVRQPTFNFQSGFWGFVETVTARRCIDWLRAARPPIGVEADLPDRSEGALDGLLAREHAALAYAAIAQLGRECRDLVYLHAGMQRSYSEIAGILGVTEGALRVRLHRCVRQAREALRGLVSVPVERKGVR